MKKTLLVILISDKIDFKTKATMKDQVCNSTSGYLSKETQNTNLKRHMHPYVHCRIIYNSQGMEAT